MNALDHRIKHGKARKRSGQWDREARALAEETGHSIQRILDVHEEQALMLEWEGLTPGEAEYRGWLNVVELLAWRKAA